MAGGETAIRALTANLNDLISRVELRPCQRNCWAEITFLGERENKRRTDWRWKQSGANLSPVGNFRSGIFTGYIRVFERTT